MNAKARDVFLAAALRGQPQERDDFYHEETGGRCALGELHAALHQGRPCVDEFDAADLDCNAELVRAYALVEHGARIKCPTCGDVFFGEFALLVHVNDDHDYDWLALAHKLPETLEEGTA